MATPALTLTIPGELRRTIADLIYAEAHRLDADAGVTRARSLRRNYLIRYAAALRDVADEIVP